MRKRKLKSGETVTIGQDVDIWEDCAHYSPFAQALEGQKVTFIARSTMKPEMMLIRSESQKVGWIESGAIKEIADGSCY